MTCFRYPVLFYKPVNSLIGPLAPIVIPSAVQPPKEHQSDYEVEFTIVIGKPAKDVSEEDALDYVLAYTGANDVSISFLTGVAAGLLTISFYRYLSENTK